MMMMMMLRVMTVVSNLRDAPRPAERRPGRARDGRGGIVRGVPAARARARARAAGKIAPVERRRRRHRRRPRPQPAPEEGRPRMRSRGPGAGRRRRVFCGGARARDGVHLEPVHLRDGLRARDPPPDRPVRRSARRRERVGVVHRRVVARSSVRSSRRGRRGGASRRRRVGGVDRRRRRRGRPPAAALLDQGSHVPRDAFAERSLGDDSPRGFDEGVQKVRRGARGDAGAEPRRPARAMRGELLDVGAVRQQIQRRVRQKRRGRPGGSIGRGGLVIGTRRVERDAGDRGMTGG